LNYLPASDELVPQMVVVRGISWNLIVQYHSFGKGHSTTITRLAFKQDGTRLASDPLTNTTRSAFWRNPKSIAAAQFQKRPWPREKLPDQARVSDVTSLVFSSEKLFATSSQTAIKEFEITKNETEAN